MSRNLFFVSWLLIIAAICGLGCGQEITPTTTTSSTTTTTLPTVYWSGRTISSTESYSSIRIYNTGNISIESGGTLTLDHVTLYVSCESDGQFGIFINSGGTFNITNESIITAYNTNEGYYSFYYKAGSTGSLYSSTVEGTFAGLSIEANNFTVSDSTVKNSKNDGIETNNVTGFHALNSYFLSNGGSGLYLISSDGTIEGNSIRNNTNGITIDNCSPLVRNNTVTGNTKGVYLQSNYGKPHPNLGDINVSNSGNNNFSGNTYGVYNSATADIKAENNYWNHFSAGDIMNYNNDTAMRIDATPWLFSPP